jgi:ankyrin repeat protein
VTPFHEAARYGHIGAMEYLVSIRADVNAQTNVSMRVRGPLDGMKSDMSNHFMLESV